MLLCLAIGVPVPDDASLLPARIDTLADVCPLTITAVSARDGRLHLLSVSEDQQLHTKAAASSGAKEWDTWAAFGSGPGTMPEAAAASRDVHGATRVAACSGDSEPGRRQVV